MDATVFVGRIEAVRPGEQTDSTSLTLRLHFQLKMSNPPAPAAVRVWIRAAAT